MTTNEWSTIVPQTDRPGERGCLRRSFNPMLHPQLGIHGCRTLYETLRHGVTANPLGPCLGYRATSTTGFATPFIYPSDREILARVESLAAGLEALDLVPPIPQDDPLLLRNSQSTLKLLGLYIPNCVEWILAEHAIFTVGGGEWTNLVMLCWWSNEVTMAYTQYLY